MIKRNLLLASAMFCSVATFAGTDMSVCQGTDVSVRIVNPNANMKFVAGTIQFGNEVFETSKVDSIVLKHYVSVNFDGDNVTVSNPFSGVDVKVDGTSVEINSSYTDREIKYKFSGRSSNGNVIFSSAYKSNFEFNNLDLSSLGVNPPIHVLTKKNTEVHLIGNNSLSDSQNDTVGATMRGKGQFEFKGEGSLNIIGSAGHGIQSSDYVEVKNGKITINAASDGIHVNDYYLQSGGDVNIVTGADGVDVGEGYATIDGGTFTVASIADEARGIRCTMTEKENSGKIDINGGVVDIQLAGQGARGLKADDDIKIDGGNVLIVMSGKTLVTANDTTATCGIKCDSIFTVESGKVVVICQSSASSSRCIQADSSVVINNGVVVLRQNSTKKLSGAKKPNCIKSDGVVVVAKVGQLYAYPYEELYNSDAKPFNVKGGVIVGGHSIDFEDDDVDDFILADPSDWETNYSIYDK